MVKNAIKAQRIPEKPGILNITVSLALKCHTENQYYMSMTSVSSKC